nr:hypothetical protein [uncultured Methanobrevibacter sp.]
MFEVGEFGTDFNSSYTFSDGDLAIVSDKQNIKQAIINRLNTQEGWYDLFYNGYGGFLHSFHGWKRLQSTLDFMKIEIVNILSQDPRFINLDVELEFNDQGEIDMKISLFYDDETDLSLSFVIDNSGNIIDDESEE